MYEFHTFRFSTVTPVTRPTRIAIECIAIQMSQTQTQRAGWRWMLDVVTA